MPDTNADDWYCISMDSPVRGRPSRGAAFALSPLSLADGSSGKNFCYAKLPHHPFRLSVLKLDGSCFDVDVARTATVADLKQAVEDVFSHFPQKGPGKISWSHVWSQFCLSYERHQLLNDAEYVRNYGVRDGDQLHFVRNVAGTCDLTRRRPKKQPSRRQDGSRGNTTRRTEQSFNGGGDVENQQAQFEEKGDMKGGLDDTFRKWYLYSRMPKPGETPQSSGFADSLLWNLREVLHVSRER